MLVSLLCSNRDRNECRQWPEAVHARRAAQASRQVQAQLAQHGAPVPSVVPRVSRPQGRERRQDQALASQVRPRALGARRVGRVAAAAHRRLDQVQDGPGAPQHCQRDLQLSRMSHSTSNTIQLFGRLVYLLMPFCLSFSS